MSYQIRYGEPGRKSGRNRRASGKRFLLPALIVLLGAVLFRVAFPTQAESVRQALFPALTEDTVAAFQEMTIQIRSGTGFGEAITAFCREIVKDAQIPAN